MTDPKHERRAREYFAKLESGTCPGGSAQAILVTEFAAVAAEARAEALEEAAKLVDIDGSATGTYFAKGIRNLKKETKP
jgi:hypothetical protein